MREKWESDRKLSFWLDRIENHFESGDIEGSWREVQSARELHPDDLFLLDWEAILLFEQGQFAGALAVQDQILGVQSDRWSTILERAHTLVELGQFEPALANLERVEKDFTTHLLVPDAARLTFAKAMCLDRLGQSEAADKEFARATAIYADSYPAVPRLEADEFEDIVRSAFESLPEEFHPFLAQIMVRIEDYPDRAQPELDPFLLGLYQGIPRTERSTDAAKPDSVEVSETGLDIENVLDRIYIFKRNLEIEFPDPERLVDEIRKTVVHEVAHHFGLGENDMGGFA